MEWKGASSAQVGGEAEMGTEWKGAPMTQVCPLSGVFAKAKERSEHNARKLGTICRVGQKLLGRRERGSIARHLRQRR